MAAMPTDTTVPRRFAVACGVLSQYVRAAAATAPLTTPPPAFAAPGGAPAPAPAPAAAAPQETSGNDDAAASQQLTIFYGGRVVVLDACPPEKAAQLIRIAAAAQGVPEPALVDMPIARKASLRRFLAKRKDRATGGAPQEHPSRDQKDDDDDEPAPKKGKHGEASSWLALGSLGDMHGR